MGIEQRRQPRREVVGRVEVFDTIAEETVGILGDVSAGGLLLIASAPLPDDALFQFRFSLSDAGRPLPTVEVGAHVLWQAPAGAPGQHYVGMRFIGLSPETALLLRQWSEAPSKPPG